MRCARPSRSSTERPARSGREQSGGLGSRLPLREPALVDQVAEHDDATTAARDDLPVATAQGALRPPAILDQPRLAHELDLPAPHGERPAAGVRAHLHGPRRAETPRVAHGSGTVFERNGASTARRSGTREHGSTASTRKAASGPAAVRAWRTASRSRAARATAGSESSGS